MRSARARGFPGNPARSSLAVMESRRYHPTASMEVFLQAASPGMHQRQPSCDGFVVPSCSPFSDVLPLHQHKDDSFDADDSFAVGEVAGHFEAPASSKTSAPRSDASRSAH
jgi:hypothetical protein